MFLTPNIQISPQQPILQNRPLVFLASHPQPPFVYFKFSILRLDIKPFNETKGSKGCIVIGQVREPETLPWSGEKKRPTKVLLGVRKNPLEHPGFSQIAKRWFVSLRNPFVSLLETKVSFKENWPTPLIFGIMKTTYNSIVPKLGRVLGPAIEENVALGVGGCFCPLEKSSCDHLWIPFRFSGEKTCCVW